MLELHPNTGKTKSRDPNTTWINSNLTQACAHPSVLLHGSHKPGCKGPAEQWEYHTKQGNPWQSEREAQHMDLAQHCDRNGLPEAQREGKKRHSEAFGVCWLRGICPNSHQVMPLDLQVIFQPRFSCSERKKSFLQCVYLIASNFHCKADEINKHIFIFIINK